MEIARNQLVLDSAIAARQYKLWQQDIGSRAEWEQKELAGKCTGKLSVCSVALSECKEGINLLG